MRRTELDQLLIDELGLLPDPAAKGDSLSFFVGKVERHPARCTRTVRVFFSGSGEPAMLQLCASSDNNNTVLLRQPFDRESLAGAIRQEIDTLRERLGVESARQPGTAKD